MNDFWEPEDKTVEDLDIVGLVMLALVVCLALVVLSRCVQ